MEGAIYDPSTERIVNGKRIRNTFSSNIIPKARFDSIAKVMQGLIPTADGYRQLARDG